MKLEGGRLRRQARKLPNKGATTHRGDAMIDGDRTSPATTAAQA
jgi:hypothetical protein